MPLLDSISMPFSSTQALPSWKRPKVPGTPSRPELQRSAGRPDELAAVLLLQVAIDTTHRGYHISDPKEGPL